MNEEVKSFKIGYPFIDLDVFLHILFYDNPTPREFEEGKSRWLYNMRLLIIVSSMTGIKMSQLIQLTWSDLILLENIQTKEINRRLKFNRFNIPLVKEIRREFTIHSYLSKQKYNDFVFTNNDGEPLNPRNLSRDVRNALNDLGFPYFSEFKTDSTQIMFGRAVIKIHGYNKRVIQELKSHLNFHSELALMKFLYIDKPEEKIRRNFYENLLTGL